MDDSNFFNDFMMNQELILSQYTPRDPSYQIANTSNPTPSAGRSADFHANDMQTTNGLYEKAPAPFPRFLSFSSQDDLLEESPDFSQGFISSDQCANVAYSESSRRIIARTRVSPLQAQDHKMAERKRREKVTQRLLALAAVIPGLKKVDKLSILEEAIKYVKELEDRLKKLEDQNTKTTIESVVLVHKSQLDAEGITSSLSDRSLDGNSVSYDSKESKLPEIEVKISNNMILIRILCEEHKGALLRVLEEIEKLQLDVLNTSVIPFVSSTLDISIVAQMEEDYCMGVRDLVSTLSSTLSQG